MRSYDEQHLSLLHDAVLLRSVTTFEQALRLADRHATPLDERYRRRIERGLRATRAEARRRGLGRCCEG